MVCWPGDFSATEWRGKRERPHKRRPNSGASWMEYRSDRIFLCTCRECSAWRIFLLLIRSLRGWVIGIETDRGAGWEVNWESGYFLGDGSDGKADFLAGSGLWPAFRLCSEQIVLCVVNVHLSLACTNRCQEAQMGEQRQRRNVERFKQRTITYVFVPLM